MEKRKQDERVRKLGGEQFPLFKRVVRIGLIEMEIGAEVRRPAWLEPSEVWEENGG